MQAKFNSIDKDRSGSLSFEELLDHSLYEWKMDNMAKKRKLARSLQPLAKQRTLVEIENSAEVEEFISQDLKIAFKEIDLNQDGEISFEEFSAYHIKKQTPISKTKQLLMAKFKSIDKDGNGWLSFDELLEHSLYEWKVDRMAEQRAKAKA